jgi:hypothetical protein
LTTGWIITPSDAQEETSIDRSIALPEFPLLTSYAALTPESSFESPFFSFFLSSVSRLQYWRERKRVENFPRRRSSDSVCIDHGA